MSANAFRIGTIALCALGIIGCVFGGLTEPAAFSRAWLCSFVLWLGIPLAGITLVLVHDLSGGDWMATARPVLQAAILTMPLASLAGIPAFVGLDSIYQWTHPPPGLGNVFYLNRHDFFVRYAIYLLVWNLLAAFALWGRRSGQPIAPGLSWISALGLIAIAFSSSFAAIDWILSLEPTFWSSIFPYTQCASWFNTGMALIVLMIAIFDWAPADGRKHMVDLAKIMLATTIFWAYVEFMQFLIIWEENLRTEIPWYLKRLDSVWQPAIYVSVGLGFVLPFFVLLCAPMKRNRRVVAVICVGILLSRLAHTWLLVVPEFTDPAPFWLDVAAVLALGGAVLLLFGFALRQISWPAATTPSVLRADHG